MDAQFSKIIAFLVHAATALDEKVVRVFESGRADIVLVFSFN